MATIRFRWGLFTSSPRYSSGKKKRFVKQPALPLLLSMKRVKVVQAFQDITIGVAGLETAKQLHIGLGEPTAESHLVLLDASGVAIFIAHFHYSRDHFAMRRILPTD